MDFCVSNGCEVREFGGGKEKKKEKERMRKGSLHHVVYQVKENFFHSWSIKSKARITGRRTHMKSSITSRICLVLTLFPFPPVCSLSASLSS